MMLRISSFARVELTMQKELIPSPLNLKLYIAGTVIEYIYYYIARSMHFESLSCFFNVREKMGEGIAEHLALAWWSFFLLSGAQRHQIGELSL